MTKMFHTFRLVAHFPSWISQSEKLEEVFVPLHCTASQWGQLQSKFESFVLEIKDFTFFLHQNIIFYNQKKKKNKVL